MSTILKPILFLQSFFLLFLTIPYSSHAIPRKIAHRSRHRPTKTELFQTRYFTQNLDHFNYNPQSYRTFQQRYLINDTYWKQQEKSKEGQAPIFVFIGHDDNIMHIAETTGILNELAPKFKALIVFIEHRYYGESLPFGSKNATFKDASTLGYLSSSQALADVATLVTDLKKNLTAKYSPVVVFGGAYGGTLASWFRLKYPHIATGALASSAPVLQFDELISPYKIGQIINEDYRSVSEDCYKTIKNSWAEIKKLVAQPSGTKKLAQKLHICKEIKRNEIMVAEVFEWLKLALTYAAEFDYPTPSTAPVSLPAYPVKKMCEAIDNPKHGKDPISRLYGAMNVFYNNTGKEKCFDVNSFSNGQDITLAWYWQRCTELIPSQMKTGNDSLIPFNYDEQRRDEEDAECARVFNIKPRPHWITTEFGGNDIKKIFSKAASNIIFFNGLRDPMCGAGVLESISKSIIALTAEKGARAADLLFSTKDDPKWLQVIRKREEEIIKRWIKQYYSDSSTI